MRSAIGGILNYSVISQVHRPRDEAAMARAVRELAAQGLTERDIGQALGLDPSAVWLLLQIGKTTGLESKQRRGDADDL